MALTDATHVHWRQGFPVSLLILAGLLTGFGTSMANGCTSGHSVFGLAAAQMTNPDKVQSFLDIACMKACNRPNRHVDAKELHR